jgi:putative membrane fusion protein
MSAQKVRKKKKRRPKYGRILFSLIFFVLIVYFMVKLGIDMFFKEHMTYLVEVDTLNIEKEYKTLILRNELVVDTAIAGQITYFTSEGSVVTKNDQVAEIFNDGSTSEIIEATERELNRKQIEFDYNSLAYDIENIKNQILFNLHNQNFDAISSYKRDLILKFERLDKLQSENKFLSNRIASYSQQTIGEGKLLEGQKKAILAPASGILTYKLDGYESFITIDNLYNINYEEISKVDINATSIIKENTSQDGTLFKIVDNATYYLVAIIPNEEVETYKNVQKITVEIGAEKLSGEVYDVFTDDQKAVVAIRMSEVFDGFYNQRWVDANVIRENYRGLKVYVDSIVNIEGQLGVYVVENDRRLKFVPIKILGYDDENAIIYNSQFYDIDQGLVRSIKTNQEVVRNAHKYKAGDRIE